MSKRFEEMKETAKTISFKRKQFMPIKLNDLLFMKFVGSKWLVDRLVPHEGITILSGAPASYKTWLLLQMAISISQGNNFLSQFQCLRDNVLVIDEENHLRLLQERLMLLGASKSLPIYFLSQKGFLVSDQALIDRVLEICRDNEIGTIFIDSLVRINDAEENDASQMSGVFKSIRKLCQNGKTVVITHHERKESVPTSSAQNRLRGSSDILAAVDAHISVKKNFKDKNKIIVEQTKLRSAKELDSFEIEVSEDEETVRFDYLGTFHDKPEKKNSAKQIIDKILQKERDGLSMKAVCQKVKMVEDIGEKNIAIATKELIKEGILSEKKGEKNTKICIHSKFN